MGSWEGRDRGGRKCTLRIRERTNRNHWAMHKEDSLSFSLFPWVTHSDGMGWDVTFTLFSHSSFSVCTVHATSYPTSSPPIFHYYYFSYSVVGAFILNYTTSIHLLILYYHTLMNCLFIYYFVNKKFNAIWVFGWLVFV